MAQTCPNCGLYSPPEAQRCDCGYDFKFHHVERSYFAPKAGGSERSPLAGIWQVWPLMGAVAIAVGIWNLDREDWEFWERVLVGTDWGPLAVGVAVVIGLTAVGLVLRAALAGAPGSFWLVWWLFVGGVLLILAVVLGSTGILWWLLFGFMLLIVSVLGLLLMVSRQEQQRFPFWERQHVGGVTAVVSKSRLLQEGEYGVCTKQPGSQPIICTRTATELEAAQLAADIESGCPQPCSCEPWKKVKVPFW